MYYIILGILMIIVNGIDMWFNVFFMPLMWDRKETKDKVSKIICWYLQLWPRSLFLRRAAQHGRII